MRTLVATALAFSAVAIGDVAFAQMVFDERSVVSIECVSPSGVIHGSGVIVSAQGLVLTARHVVPDGSTCSGSIGIANPAARRPMILRQPVTNYDATLLEFVPAPGDGFAWVQWVDRSVASKDQEIMIYGFPGDGTGEVSHRAGIISTSTPDSNGYIETDAHSTGGMSGGPVILKANGALAGLVVGAGFDLTSTPTSYRVLSAEMFAPGFGLTRASGSDALERPVDGTWTVVISCPSGAKVQELSAQFSQGRYNRTFGSAGYAAGETQLSMYLRSPTEIRVTGNIAFDNGDIYPLDGAGSGLNNSFSGVATYGSHSNCPFNATRL